MAGEAKEVNVGAGYDVRDGTWGAAVGSSFQPGNFLDYIHALAQFSSGGVDRMELAIARAQLKAFSRSKGYPALPEFHLCEGLENDAEIPPAVAADSSSPVFPDSIPQKGKLRGPPVDILENGRKTKSLSELMGGKTAGRRASSRSSSEKGKAFDSRSGGAMKRKRLDSEDEMQGLISNPEDENEECEPTAMFLSFDKPSSRPSVADLHRVLGGYGPLREGETKVSKLYAPTEAKVVFKRRADAEAAFREAQDRSIFGQALVSFRLRYLCSARKPSPSTSTSGKEDESRNEHASLNFPVEEYGALVSK